MNSFTVPLLFLKKPSPSPSPLSKKRGVTNYILMDFTLPLLFKRAER